MICTRRAGGEDIIEEALAVAFVATFRLGVGRRSDHPCPVYLSTFGKASRLVKYNGEVCKSQTDLMPG